MPSPMMLDLERAISVTGGIDDAGSLARYMSLNGASQRREAVQAVLLAAAAQPMHVDQPADPGSQNVESTRAEGLTALPATAWGSDYLVPRTVVLLVR
jgi:hypothetical protein